MNTCHASAKRYVPTVVVSVITLGPLAWFGLVSGDPYKMLASLLPAGALALISSFVIWHMKAPVISSENNRINVRGNFLGKSHSIYASDYQLIIEKEILTFRHPDCPDIVVDMKHLGNSTAHKLAEHLKTLPFAGVVIEERSNQALKTDAASSAV